MGLSNRMKRERKAARMQVVKEKLAKRLSMSLAEHVKQRDK